jgi:hypothetical protein
MPKPVPREGSVGGRKANVSRFQAPRMPVGAPPMGFGPALLASDPPIFSSKGRHCPSHPLVNALGGRKEALAGTNFAPARASFLSEGTSVLYATASFAAVCAGLAAGRPG